MVIFFIETTTLSYVKYFKYIDKANKMISERTVPIQLEQNFI